jgi:hypothetical protein
MDGADRIDAGRKALIRDMSGEENSTADITWLEARSGMEMHDISTRGCSYLPSNGPVRA